MREMYSEWQMRDDLRWRAQAAQPPVTPPTPVAPVAPVALVAPVAPVAQTVHEETLALQLKEAVQDLACVRVVGKALLPTGADLFPLISSFIVSINIPIDVAVNRASHHITEWLLANGAKPTYRTAHVAVITGSLPMVQMIFQHLNLQYHGKEGVPSHVFTDLPLVDHLEIAEWILREYPAQMAHEAVRVAAMHSEYLKTPLTWYAQRLKRHWEWEEQYATEIYRRKRARANDLPQV